MSEENDKFKIITYHKLGGGAGFLINQEDLNFVSLSKARAAQCWMGIDSKISTWEWEMGDAINLPEKHFWKMVQIENDGELGKDLISRYLSDLELKNLINLTNIKS